MYACGLAFPTLLHETKSLNYSFSKRLESMNVLTPRRAERVELDPGVIRPMLDRKVQQL